jgi:predicted ester cyclase
MPAQAESGGEIVKHPNSEHDGMRGFDPEFLDIPHYIRVITDRIWEQRRIDDIHRYYSDPCIVETPLSVSTALSDVITGTEATLTVFPDRRLLAEDIIVSGDDEYGYLSSHRIISPMTHLGDGSFGLATGKKVHARTIADCVCKDNRIVHEWLVRDHAAIAYAIGTTPKALAAKWLNERAGWHKPKARSAPDNYESHVSRFPLAAQYAGVIQHFAAKATHTQSALTLYDEAVHQIAPGESHHYGQQELSAYWRDLFCAFSVERFTIEHLAENVSPERGLRVALRWRALAKHDAVGEFGQRFGDATGRSVEIMGINHVEIADGKILREWVLIDEVALWMQVL